MKLLAQDRSEWQKPVSVFVSQEAGKEMSSSWCGWITAPKLSGWWQKWTTKALINSQHYQIKESKMICPWLAQGPKKRETITACTDESSRYQILRYQWRRQCGITPKRTVSWTIATLSRSERNINKLYLWWRTYSQGKQTACIHTYIIHTYIIHTCIYIYTNIYIHLNTIWR